MVYYKPIKVTIDTLDLAKVIINIVIQYHGIPESIMTDQSILFTSKFWFLLCYLLVIKKKLFIAFYLQTNG